METAWPGNNLHAIRTHEGPHTQLWKRYHCNYRSHSPDIMTPTPWIAEHSRRHIISNHTYMQAFQYTLLASGRDLQSSGTIVTDNWQKVLSRWLFNHTFDTKTESKLEQFWRSTRKTESCIVYAPKGPCRRFGRGITTLSRTSSW